jgi:hypothetical protein
LAAAFAIAQEMDRDETIIVQETEYTGAGKHVQPQLAFARDNGIEIKFGDPRDEKPGTSIILPKDPSFIRARDLEMDDLRRSYIRHSVEFARQLHGGDQGAAELRFDENDMIFLAEETRYSREQVEKAVSDLGLR